ncbi:xylose isomerase [Acetobacter nitrogenifigens DSM 23921 = NBRC 105050]|uniref:Xylose isomerase n=1 Tax=Acetobacter nitrogenifigens DSM 23921 = NBRC 105050 TaxID=1120919 RepID=A0A511XBY6_9PROT|nr:TIM barrel protein [Acetobacter nitrogenifigens]GBQ88767.1 xylose isomerase [Acetobacter nitrogenifigens DSM 23921 = NBRC 105050]GEN60487.1 hypothetical protein ANI02nite_23710 [Acetobacter nitrogenifigens DSM 23921 = NBRC 105050]
MRLDLFRTLWGDWRGWRDILPETHAAGFTGVEARTPETPPEASEKARILADSGMQYIAIALTGGGVIPRQSATFDDHLDDLRVALDRVAPMRPLFVNVLGGNDRWNAGLQADFINKAHEIGLERGVRCVFETHRSRILASPWITLDVLPRCPDALFTVDISHWVVVCERLLDDPTDDLSLFVERVHHIQARIGYAQGPQVPHPAAPEYGKERRFHQDFWESVWLSQSRRGYETTTMTPEFGPDGYLHTLPFTDAPVANLWALNRWMADEERRHFNHWNMERRGP